MAKGKKFVKLCLNVPYFYIQNQGTLSLTATARFTGIVIDIRHGITQITPVPDGYYIQDSIVCQDMCGRDITEYLQILLNQNRGTLSYEFKTAVERIYVQDIKKKFFLFL